MTTQLLIEHGSVLTMNDADELIEDGAVLIEGDRIVDVGTTSEVRGRHELSEVRVIDATDKAVLPGLVDLHFHTAITARAGRTTCHCGNTSTPVGILIRALHHDAAYWAALASYLESIKGGVTTVNDMYRKLGALRRAAEEIGIRAVLANDIADDEHGLDTLEDARTAHREHHGAANGRIEVYVGIEWLPLASEELLRGARALADELGTGIHIHLNESQTEVDNSIERFGRRPTEVAYDCGILGPDCVAAHCVWLSDHEIDLMKETGTQISHNPSSNAKLGNGIARLPEMLAAGINVGLGHDVAECNNSRDLFEVMKFSSLIHRASRVDASLQQAPDVLRMATGNGSAALDHDTGELAAGKKADVILVELKSAMFTPLVKGNRDHLTSHLVFAANGSCVDTTIIDGQVVMEGRTLLTVDEATVLREANAAFTRILERMEVPAS